MQTKSYVALSGRLILPYTVRAQAGDVWKSLNDGDKPDAVQRRCLRKSGYSVVRCTIVVEGSK